MTLDIVTTHVNSDFDALASMVAATFVHPGSVGVVPSQVQTPVREFLAVHRDLFRITPRKNFDLNKVRSLVVTDTSNWNRLDAMQDLASRTDLPVTIWDHHMTPGTIQAREVHRHEVGAAVTLLLERMRDMDCAFAPMHATLFLLGIYDDTGSLTYPSTTARDAHMAGYLLENGADLNVVSAYLDSSLDSRHVDLFTRMLSTSQTMEVRGLHLGVCVQDVDKSLNMLPSVVSKFQEVKGLDAAFGIFPMSGRKTAVIARGNPRLFDVGAVVRTLGGGGHPGAGSAIVQASVEEVRARVMDLLLQAEACDIGVQQVMTPLDLWLTPDKTLREAAAILEEEKRDALLVLEDDATLLGCLEAAQLEKIQSPKQWDKSVKAMMRQNVSVVHPDQPLREALEAMTRSHIGFLPVVNQNRVIGRVTRAAIILQMYDF